MMMGTVRAIMLRVDIAAIETFGRQAHIHMCRCKT